MDDGKRSKKLIQFPTEQVLRERALSTVRELVYAMPATSPEAVALAQCYLQLRRIDGQG